MPADIREAERAGACVYAVEWLTIIGNELRRSCRYTKNAAQTSGGMMF